MKKLNQKIGYFLWHQLIMSSQSKFASDNIILCRRVTSLPLSEILSDIDLENYEKATTTYRKPCYQRGKKGSNLWRKALVESVIKGKSIGSLHLSEWCKMRYEGDESYTEKFYNIEDGQTRLNSLLEFKEGKFDTEFGNYDDENIREIFNSYQVPIVMLSKKNSRVRDSDYFRELNDNFSSLQESTSLTASDRYWAWSESIESNFAGSPLVNLTVNLVKDERFKDLFQDYMKVKNMERRDNSSRQQLANMVGLVSGAWKGAEYANSTYFTHVPVIQTPITQEDKERIETVLLDIQLIIGNSLKKKCKYYGEHLGAMFKTTQKFTGSMMMDLEGKSDEEKVNVFECWEAFINEYRKRKEKNIEIRWLNEEVYMDLCDGHRRNCNKDDFEVRLEAVKAWWSNYSE